MNRSRPAFSRTKSIAIDRRPAAPFAEPGVDRRGKPETALTIDHEPPRPLPHDIRSQRVDRLATLLERLPFEIYEALAKSSCGEIDPHTRERRDAAVRLARIIIPR